MIEKSSDLKNLIDQADQAQKAEPELLTGRLEHGGVVIEPDTDLSQFTLDQLQACLIATSENARSPKEPNYYLWSAVSGVVSDAQLAQHLHSEVNLKITPQQALTNKT